MKLTRFVHACLLAETENSSILFDPGLYSWESGTCDVSKIEKLETVVITHVHPDHFHPPFVEALVQKFPDLRIVSTPAVIKKLQEMGIQNGVNDSIDKIQVFSKKPHAPLPPLASETPDNIAVHFADQLTVGGDRHDLEETKDILAFTIVAPWGSVRNALKMVLELQPKYALPLHDWHWHEEARQQQYDRFEELLGAQGITFLRPVEGTSLEV